MEAVAEGGSECGWWRVINPPPAFFAPLRVPRRNSPHRGPSRHASRLPPPCPAPTEARKASPSSCRAGIARPGAPLAMPPALPLLGLRRRRPGPGTIGRPPLLSPPRPAPTKAQAALVSPPPTPLGLRRQKPMGLPSSPPLGLRLKKPGRPRPRPKKKCPPRPAPTKICPASPARISLRRPRGEPLKMNPRRRGNATAVGAHGSCK